METIEPDFSGSRDGQFILVGFVWNYPDASAAEAQTRMQELLEDFRLPTTDYVMFLSQSKAFVWTTSDSGTVRFVAEVLVGEVFGRVFGDVVKTRRVQGSALSGAAATWVRRLSDENEPADGTPAWDALSSIGLIDALRGSGRVAVTS